MLLALLAALSAVLFVARPSQAADIPPGPAKTTDRLNLREGPGLGFSVVAVMPLGASVTVTGAPENGFYPVTYGNKKGWAFGAYLEPVTESSTEKRDRLRAGPAHTTTRLNLRRGPGLGHSVILVMPARSRLRITGAARNDFYPVAYEGRRGWAFGTYLKPGNPPREEPQPAVTTLQKRVRRLLVKRGLGREWDAAARIIACESGWNPKQLARDRNGYYSRGLWQINDQYHGWRWKQYGLKWDDPIDNTIMAIKIYRDWDGWGAWSCYGAPPPRGALP